MKKIIHRANTRGAANFGWLDSHHSFSFGQYYNPERMGFGLLRVLNDDHVAASKGFGAHPHANMEIVSIPLSGVLVHQDSMGNKKEIKTGDVQIMSAGTGVQHSEFNGSDSEAVKFLQIWVFPKVQDIEPRYEQKTFDEAKKHNHFLTVVSPDKADTEAVWINQDARFSLANFDESYSDSYKLHNENNGIYVFSLEGRLELAGEILDKRDGIGLTGDRSFDIKALKDSKFLIIEVPMG